MRNTVIAEFFDRFGDAGVKFSLGVPVIPIIQKMFYQLIVVLFMGKDHQLPSPVTSFFLPVAHYMLPVIQGDNFDLQGAQLTLQGTLILLQGG
ncbi:hypothetical protein QWY93_15815 [Echinicola jeungdonensis]|uniref:Uncharacterized protein n=1 Tax=Echinicola jeungdonensis TaxID=709343 RepID=A0ABV5J6Y1_9BACT|nr:hypothetical protein [Echinicola jeungdonensis]MDN3670788.1 hypothetical protein [Echinicola jeungdonensis]